MFLLNNKAQVTWILMHFQLADRDRLVSYSNINVDLSHWYRAGCRPVVCVILCRVRVLLWAFYFWILLIF